MEDVFFAEIPLFSARDIRGWLFYFMSRQLLKEAILQMISAHHLRQQRDITYANSKEYTNLSKEN